jgi:hypothetical protein
MAAVEEKAKKVELAFKQALETAGVTGLTYRLYHADDSGSGDDEPIVYPVCQIVAEPAQEVQPNATLFAMSVAVAVATYYDDDKLRQTLSEKASDVWIALTASSVDTAMGTVSGASNLGVQGLEQGDPATLLEGNDQRQIRVYTAHLFDQSTLTTTTTT